MNVIRLYSDGIFPITVSGSVTVTGRQLRKEKAEVERGKSDRSWELRFRNRNEQERIIDTRILARKGKQIDNRMIEMNREIREDRIKERLRESIEEIDG